MISSSINEKLFFNQSIEELVYYFKTNLETGLNPNEINIRQLKYGLNELPKVKKSYWKIYLSPFFNFLIIILIISSLIIILLGDYFSTIITLFVIFINSAIAIIQQYRAQKALESLKKISTLKATVIRNGHKIQVLNKDLVPGDIIIIKSGDKIPADGRIFESSDLTIEEAPLTGESEPVEKNCEIISDNDVFIHHQTNMVFMGTFVDTGKAKILVTNTGTKTEIGKISYSLNEMGSIEEIPLVKKLNRLGYILGSVVFINCFILIIYQIIFLDKNINRVLIDSILIAMNIVPVNLPLVTTLVIITGVLKMAQSGVIIKNLTSIESLGRVSVLCSDKTGTITKNEMCVQKFWLNEKEYDVDGSGYEINGQIYLDGNMIDLSDNPNFQKFIASIVVNNTAELLFEGINKSINHKFQKAIKQIIGSPTEAALLVLAEKAGYKIDNIRKNFKVIREFPFTSELKKMSSICKLDTLEDSYLLFSKGAAEIILEDSSFIEIDGKVEEMNDEIRYKLVDMIFQRASEGYRILSIAYKNLDKYDELDREKLEKNLIYLGFVSIMDPPRFEVKQSVKVCKYAGIKVIMITGDHPLTAKTIASSIGILDESEREMVVEGLSIKYFKRNQFQNITVYSRVNPSDKELIVEQYQKMEKVVAMTGDGINDALALKKAEIGIAMGIKGTDIAKETADIILTDDNFTSIVKGIQIGRGIFSNIRLLIYFFICLNLMEGFIYFFYSFIPIFEIFSSNWQHVYIFTIIHGLISLGLVIDKPPKDIMNEMPRNGEEILNKNIWIILIIHSFLMGIGVVFALQLTLGNFIPLNEFNINPSLSYFPPSIVTIKEGEILEMKARTMFFTTVFITETNFIWAVRRLNKSIIKSIKEEFNITLFTICMFTLGIHVLLVLFSYPVNTVINDQWNLPLQLNFLFLSPYDWLICIFLSFPGLFGIEIIKFIARKKNIVF
ncbi:MAG: cation-translocating P-type ATPase [Promethearchaeota archaeon]